ncbi:MAG: sodium:solute symporter family protein [Ignavibacteriales bacterium]|nr:sodium:solute symporter family protein [Ignavibacteriales bacterium]
MIDLHAVDVLVILLYFLAVVTIGYRAGKRASGASDDYLLAGRTLTLPMFVATLVSTWYGGILGVGEFSYRYGLSNWFVFGAPYYIFATLFALFLARRIRSTNLATIPDKLENAYDRKTALLGSVLTFILITPAAYVLMLGILIQLLFGFDLATSVILTTIVTIWYLYAGGFRSDVWVNAFEFVMMFLGFAMMLFFAVSRFGGFDFISENVPDLHLTWHGGNTLQYIAVWFFIALWTLVDPAFHQRCYAAKDGPTARRGIFVSILFWFCFDFLTTATGLYARAALPPLEQPMFSYPLFAEATLPMIAKGLFYVGLLATIMSSLSSLMFISATTVGNDIAGRLSRAADRAFVIQKWSKRGLTIGGCVAVGLALLVPSVVSLWYTIGTTIIPGLLVPVVASYFERLRISSGFAFAAMLAGPLVSAGSLIYGVLNRVDGESGYWWGIEPMMPGLAASIVVWAIGRYRHGRRQTLS